RFRERSQFHSPDTVGKIPLQAPCHFHGQPRLPAAARARKGHEPRRGQEPRDLRDLPLAPDEGGEIGGEVVRRGGPFPGHPRPPVDLWADVRRERVTVLRDVGLTEMAGEEGLWPLAWH